MEGKSLRELTGGLISHPDAAECLSKRVRYQEEISHKFKVLRGYDPFPNRT